MSLHNSHEYDNLTAPASDSPVASKSERLRANAMEILEYDSVRESVAGRTAFFPAKSLAMNMLPFWEPAEVARLQTETAEARRMIDESGDVDLFAPTDVSQWVKRASLGGILTGTELLEVADSLEAHRRAKTGIVRARRTAPSLAGMAEGITELDELRRQIRMRINDRGEVADDATHALRAIRSQLRNAYERVTSSLNRLIQSPTGREALQDQVISVRGDRLVLQVKSEMRNRVPGIVHDASNTGATLFIEPFTTVDHGNQWRELALEEEREIRKVLRDLTTLVGQLAEEILLNTRLTAELDFILARARYSYSIRGVQPPAASQTGVSPRSGDPAVRLVNSRHPLLGRGAVPITIGIGPGWSVLVVTGPNTGGKTVAMKTVGLLALMHQSGLQIPADEGSTLRIFDGVYADVGDQQSIEESVSTFSSHIKNVIDILDVATPSSLVLMDELGTSTDPEEGSAIAKAILQDLAEHGVTAIATTHYRNVAAFAEASQGMSNASVQLDSETLQPTYTVTMGIPGRSYAMNVASSLGLRQDILENARALMEPQYLRFEDWLTELQKDRDQLQNRIVETEAERTALAAQKAALDEQMQYLARHREDILDSVRRAAIDQYEDVRRKLRRAEAAMSWVPEGASGERPRFDISTARREIEAQRQQISAVPVSIVRAEPRPLAVGDQVQVRGLQLRGEIIALPVQGTEVEVNVGRVNLKVDISRLHRVDEDPEALPEQPNVKIDLGPILDTMELDLRGQRVEEALSRLEEFLDKAMRDGLRSVRIIHGRGTGALRNAVREHMRRHPYVRSFEPEVRERGGDGATLAQLD